MKALAEIQVIPIGVGVSVRKEVMRAHEIIRGSGLKVQLHAYGTNAEGDLDMILATVKELHETLHAEGTKRLSTDGQNRYADRQGGKPGGQALRTRVALGEGGCMLHPAHRLRSIRHDFPQTDVFASCVHDRSGVPEGMRRSRS